MQYCDIRRESRAKSGERAPDLSGAFACCEVIRGGCCRREAAGNDYKFRRSSNHRDHLLLCLPIKYRKKLDKAI